MESRLASRGGLSRISQPVKMLPVDFRRGLQPDPDSEEDGIQYQWDIPDKFAEKLKGLLRHPRGPASLLYGPEVMEKAELPVKVSLAGQGRATMAMPVLARPTSASEWDKVYTHVKCMIAKILADEPTVSSVKFPRGKSWKVVRVLPLTSLNC